MRIIALITILTVLVCLSFYGYIALLVTCMAMFGPFLAILLHSIAVGLVIGIMVYITGRVTSKKGKKE